MNTLKITTKSILLFVGILLVASTISCKKKKKEEEIVVPVGAYESGVFIVNEGPFGSGTGTISHFNKTNLSTTNDIFQLSNQFPLGNIVQSLNFINGKGYVVVNNANQIIVVEEGNFNYSITINGFESPRTILQVNPFKAYVTEWGSGGFGKVKIVNLLTNTIAGEIAITRNGPENMLKKGDYVYVTCKGAYGEDSMVTVINSVTDVVITNINVGANPDDIKEDATGAIWVLCAGKYLPDYSAIDVSGGLAKIDPTTNTVTASYSFNNFTSQPSGLEVNLSKDKLYYNNNGGIYSQAISASSLENNLVVNRNFYSIGIDPASQIIYAGDAGNYSSEGKVIRYTINGTKIDSLNVGVIPGAYYFK